MRTKLVMVLLGSALAACSYQPHDLADRGVESVNQPVLTTSTFVNDVAAPGGVLAPMDLGRLDGWFQGLNLGYGDSIYVDGAYSDAARVQVADIAGKYGMMVLPTAPVTSGAVPPGTVRVVVSRTPAEVPGCPNWSVPSQPNYNNRSMSNYGCGVNTALTQMVADPQDLLHGREGSVAVDAATGAKAILMYRNWPLTGIVEGQQKRPLRDASTKKDSQ